MTWPGGGRGYGGNAGHGQQGPGGWRQPTYPDTGGWQTTPYGGLGVYPAPGGYPGPGQQPPRKKRTLTIVLSVVAVLVLVLVGGGAVALYQQKSHRANSASPSRPNSPSRTETARPSPSSPPTILPPTIAGWQVVPTQRGLAYDVPPTWKVQPPDTVIGFKDPTGAPLVEIKNPATYQDGYCPGQSGSSRAGAGVTGSNESDPATSATSAAQTWATAGYTTENGTPPAVTLSQPEPITASGVQGMHVTANFTVVPQSDCDPPAGVVHAVAFPTGNGTGTILFIAYADQGVDQAETDQDLLQMINSIRAGK